VVYNKKGTCERLNQTPKDRTYGSIQRDYLLWRGKKEAEIESPYLNVTTVGRSPNP